MKKLSLYFASKKGKLKSSLKVYISMTFFASEESQMAKVRKEWPLLFIVYGSMNGFVPFIAFSRVSMQCNTLID